VLQPRRDPLTGDVLAPVERFSLMVQGVMRKWKFIIAYSVLTGLWWWHPVWFGDNKQDLHWQLGASYAAVLIESVVGIGMFGWARRDSVILRKVHTLERKAQQADENNHVLLHEMLKLMRETKAQTTLLKEVYAAAKTEVSAQTKERVRAQEHDQKEDLAHDAEAIILDAIINPIDPEEAP
jgi:hypothetical protein